MGRTLIARSTPRMTYKSGMRAGMGSFSFKRQSRRPERGGGWSGLLNSKVGRAGYLMCLKYSRPLLKYPGGDDRKDWLEKGKQLQD